jgi:hypothetical protein
MAITNKEINLDQLSRELGNKGLVCDFNDPKKKLILPAEGVELTESQLSEAIENHVAIDDSAIREAARQEILDRLGLTADEAKLLLG